MNQEQTEQITMGVEMDYQRARLRAALGRLASALSHRSNSLQPLSEAKSGVECHGQISLMEVRQVPIASIKGSVGRAREFDRNFNPIRTNTQLRWERVNLAALYGKTLPPVKLYKLGGTYFVQDGHHRVSVARYRGIDFVDAEVIELVTA